MLRSRLAACFSGWIAAVLLLTALGCDGPRPTERSDSSRTPRSTKPAEDRPPKDDPG